MRAGKACAIGVSNFIPDRWLDLFHFLRNKTGGQPDRNTCVSAAENCACFNEEIWHTTRIVVAVCGRKKTVCLQTKY